MKLKIFSDQSYLPEGVAYDVIFYPFWEKPPETTYNPLWRAYFENSGRFENYVEIGHSFFEMSSLEEADLAIVPNNWAYAMDLEDQSLLIQFAEKAKQAGKLLVIFFAGDYSYREIPIESDLVFRHSLYRSTRKATDFAMPCWSGDLLKKDLDNQLPIRQKHSKPIVGFCGLSAKNNFKTYLKLLFYRGARLFKSKLAIPPYYYGHLLRFQALSILSKSPIIETNFVERERNFFSNSDLIMQQKIRAEFVHNMVESDYVLCCRGFANYSIRFYETLCCGRIPVFIDTGCVLPYDFEIDWMKYCVWVDESELPLIAEKIAEFHENLSPQEFLDLQHECRRVWEQRLSPEGFFANLYRHLPIAPASHFGN